MSVVEGVHINPPSMVEEEPVEVFAVDKTRKPSSILSNQNENLLDYTPNSAKERLHKAKFESNNGIIVTAIYICKTIVGAGFLSLPVALDAAGWGLGIFMFFFFGIMSFSTCHFLATIVNNFREFMLPRSPYTEYEDDPEEDEISEASMTTDQLIARDIDKKKWQVNQYSMADIMFGRKFAWVFDAVLFINTWPTTIPYYQIIGDTASRIFDYNLNVSSEDQTLWRTLFIIFAALAWFPFCFSRTIVSVTKYTSAVGVLGLFYCILLGIGFVNFNWTEFPVTEDVEQPNGEIIQEEIFKEVVTNVGVKNFVDFLFRISNFAFAFGCQFSLFYAYNEQGKNANVHNGTKAAGLAQGTCAVIYFLMMVFMYATFGSNIAGSFMVQLHDTYRTNAAVVIGQVFLFIGVSASLPIFQFAGRNALLSLIGLRSATYEKARKKIVWCGIKLPAWVWRGIFSLVLVVIAASTAILVDDLSFVLSFLGIISSTPVVIVTPAYFFVRCYSSVFKPVTERRMWKKYGVPDTEKPDYPIMWEQPAWKVYWAWFIFILGMLIIVVGLIASALFLAEIGCDQCL